MQIVTMKKSFYKICFLVIWMIALIGVGNSNAGPPKNATIVTTVNIAKPLALNVVMGDNVVVTAFEVNITSVQENRTCYIYSPAAPSLKTCNSLVWLSKGIYERDVSKRSNKSDITPRCRSSDLV